MWLGHRRLAIVDLTPDGNQPLRNAAGTLWLTANGEIYNAPALRAELTRRGHRFLSHSDNEAILHAYAEWGDACVKRLEGMFAFVLWDAEKQRALAARDAIGIKPLFWRRIGSGVAFASEAKAIVPLTLQAPPIDSLALGYVLTTGSVPAPLSIWRGVRKLEPGACLSWSTNEGAREVRYWTPPNALDDQPATQQAWVPLFHQVLQDHLQADTPLAMLLSGGLDSNSVAAGLAELGHPLTAFGVSFPESPRDEAPRAQAAAQALGMPFQRVPLPGVDVPELRNEVWRSLDEPSGYSAHLPMFRLSRVVARSYKVALSGDGGDEVFGGYAWYRDLRLPRRRGTLMRRALETLVKRAESPRATHAAMAQFSRHSALHRHAMRQFPRFLPEEVEALLAPMGQRFDDEAMLAPMARWFSPDLPLRRALQRVDLMTFCSDHVLTKADRASMAFGLEARVPLLDKRVVEWGLTRAVTDDEESRAKGVLRDYLATRLPNLEQDYFKQGFSNRAAVQRDIPAMTQRIADGYWVRNGLWSPIWQRLIRPGMPYHEARLEVLYGLTLWAEHNLRD
ncbi:putative asparagine synthase [Magnetofaba australis IT-1]|uniref:asparagine synthase (glutamine-hydrolyzing) n=1 Tax=Magnetofaba australis IT-1 TaxID=1434232 RepID=A0A1Y2K1G3_9PROT|nr:putative asparagine synthase [Magnetofaba australis IT-1]